MTTFRIDATEVEALADRLDRLSGDVLRGLARDAVNEAAERADDLSMGRILERMNLTRAYLREKIRVERAAEPGNTVRAEIVASGDLTILSHYGAQQLRTGVGPRGGRGAGVSVEVRRGNRLTRDKWFMMKLKYTGGKLGVFQRIDGKAKHLYGPAPYSLLRQQGTYHADEHGDILEEVMLRRANEAIAAALA